MKLKNGEIFNAKQPLEKLLQEKLPIKTSYGLVKLTAIFNEQLGVIDTCRKNLVETYGDKDGEKIEVRQGTDNFRKFAEEYGELMSEEVDIEIEVVTLPDTLEIEPSVLMALDKFIKI